MHRYLSLLPGYGIIITTLLLSHVTCLVPPFKFLYLESSGQCPDGVKVTDASLPLGEGGCQALGGEITHASFVGKIQLRQFEVCGADTADELQGIVIAKPGMCIGTEVYPVYVGPMYGHPCFALRGKEISISESAFPQTHCQLEVCRKAKVANMSTVVFSGGSGNCSEKDQAGRASLLVRDLDDCSDLYGEPAGTTPLNHTQCWLNLCHLTTPDCKTSQLGKEYTGRLSVTKTGKSCQRWDSGVPHDHGNHDPDQFPEESLADAANYCRNPMDSMEGPFCYTTDPDTPWETCDLPYCKGYKERVEDFRIDTSRYFYVPGRHSDPATYCAQAFGAKPTVIQGSSELEQLSLWLAHLNLKGHMTKPRVWVGGRAPVGVAPETMFTDYENVTKEGDQGPCLLLSNWDEETQSYNASSFAQYTSNCSHFYDSFLCHLSEARIKDFQVYGGVPQIRVHDQEACIRSCQGECLAAGFNSLEDSCFHYFTDVLVPGRGKWNSVYVQKAPSVCNRLLLLNDEEVVITASSLKTRKVHSAKQAKITSKTLTTDNGVLAGAWIPAKSNRKQWIQAQFSQKWMIYGLVLLGMDSVDGSLIKTFKLQTSLHPQCNDWKYIDGERIFQTAGATDDSVTILFDRAVVVYCVRLIPRSWRNRKISLRFDVIGCTEGANNLALGAKVSPEEGYNRIPTWKATDGFTNPLSSWGGCVMTKETYKPWLAVDLVDNYDIDEIHVFGQECCGGELKDITVNILKFKAFLRSKETESICGHISRMESLVGIVVCSPTKTGNHVQIQNLGVSQVAVCEIKVYGAKSVLQNVALKKPAYQSDTADDSVAGRAVDGNNDGIFFRGGCSSTGATHESQWWMVDLGETFRVKQILIHAKIGSNCGRGLGRLRTYGGNAEGAECLYSFYWNNTLYYGCVAHKDDARLWCPTTREYQTNLTWGYCMDLTRRVNIYVGESREDRDLINANNLCTADDTPQRNIDQLHNTCTTPRTGRFVKIILNEKESLDLCEVEVLAEPVDGDA